MAVLRSSLLLGLVLALGVSMASASLSIPSLTRSSFNAKSIAKIASTIKKKHAACKPNVCFLLDGSGSINSGNYKLQKEFVFTAAALLDISNQDSRYSALQYGGTPAVVISEPTSNPQSFQEDVLASVSKAYDRTSMVPAMLYCMTRFPGNGATRTSPNKIVLMGDGRSNFGPVTGPFGPVSVANMFSRRANNDLVAVAVGRANKKKLEAIAGSKGKVLGVDAWGVLQLQNLFVPLVDAICKTN